MTYKQTIIINSDLNMGKGKIVAQALHGEVYYMMAVKKAPSGSEKKVTFKKWVSEEGGLMKKVVLKATENEMNDIILKLKDINVWHFLVHDAGLTQVEPGSFTCMAVEPLEENFSDQLFRHLKLL